MQAAPGWGLITGQMSTWPGLIKGQARGRTMSNAWPSNDIHASNPPPNPDFAPGGGGGGGISRNNDRRLDSLKWSHPVRLWHIDFIHIFRIKSMQSVVSSPADQKCYLKWSVIRHSCSQILYPPVTKNSIRPQNIILG